MLVQPERKKKKEKEKSKESEMESLLGKRDRSEGEAETKEAVTRQESGGPGGYSRVPSFVGEEEVKEKPKVEAKTQAPGSATIASSASAASPVAAAPAVSAPKPDWSVLKPVEKPKPVESIYPTSLRAPEQKLEEKKKLAPAAEVKKPAQVSPAQVSVAQPRSWFGGLFGRAKAPAVSIYPAVAREANQAKIHSMVMEDLVEFKLNASGLVKTKDFKESKEAKHMTATVIPAKEATTTQQFKWPDTAVKVTFKCSVVDVKNLQLGGHGLSAERAACQLFAARLTTTEMRAIHKYNVPGLIHAYNAQLLLRFLLLYNRLRFPRRHFFRRSEELFLESFQLLEG